MMKNKSITTVDNSKTLYSKEFKQHYHSIDDGALNESMVKYILPTFEIFENLSTIDSFSILDICFGLGYNTFSTLLYMQENNIDIPITIYSPEFDTNLLNSLQYFEYPEEFDKINNFQEILQNISSHFYYKNKNIEIIIYNGDARKYLRELNKNHINIDVVYQDAFSSDVNPLLWTQEYFDDIAQISSENCIICTYSIATPIRIGMYNSGFEIYHKKYISTSDKFRHITISSKKEINLKDCKKIDMKKKIDNSISPNSLSDKNY
jgi:tRNA U34 5-methylaminomethyl-2-thiouridine-forming methyltransferase MnmC